MKKMLVTGGVGFLGAHVCKRLAQEGYELLAVDSLATGSRERAAFWPLRVGDAADAVFMESVFSEFRPDGVIHLAASCNPAESERKPQLYYHNNVATTLTVLDAMVKHGVKHIVYASSSMVYGELPQHVPYTEHVPCQPENPYAATKYMGEQLIRHYSAAYGLRHVIMRHFNPAGADADGTLGESPGGGGHAAAVLAKTALGLLPLFAFYGTDYPTPDGSSIRDYVHVTDVAHAHANALRYLQDGKDSLTVNIGTARGTSLKELLAATEAFCGRNLPVEYLPRRDIYKAYLVADITAAQKALGWSPVHSSLENIIETTFRWFEKAAAKEA